MFYQADFHVHSNFSGDCDTSAQLMIESAIQKQLKEICFTEHMDIDYPEDIDFTVDYHDIIPIMRNLQEKYAKSIAIKMGVELGLQPHLKEENLNFSKAFPFDYIIGSTHVVQREDPYFGGYYKKRSKQEAYKDYFQEILNNIKDNYCFDCLGHLDYIIRYYPGNDKSYQIKDYGDIIDKILCTLINQGQGIEVNTSGLRKDIQQTHPHYSVVKRYRELGGKIITLGSDAHEAHHVGHHFKEVLLQLKDFGFDGIYSFKKRQAIFHPF